MTEGTPKAIEPKGIVRNATKIGVQDGQAEDLINLRFMDGSWRASGNGRYIYTPDRIYSNIFIHTNVYRHVIGIYGGKVYWFANISEDGVFEDIEPVQLIQEASPEIKYACAGHALIAIDGPLRTGLLFKRATGMYELIEQYNNEAAEVNPYGSVQFRCVNNFSDDGEPEVLIEEVDNNFPTNVDIITPGTQMYRDYKNAVYEGYTNLITYMKQDKSFHGCFLACIALRMYDGNYTFASAPVLVNPSFYGDLVEDDVPAYVIPDSTTSGHMPDPMYMFSLCGMKEHVKYYSDSCQKYRYDGQGTLRTALAEGVYYSCGKREVFVGTTGKTVPSPANNGYQRFGFKDWDYLPTIGDFQLAVDSAAFPLPTSFQPHVFYGKSNHLEFRFDSLNIDPTIYTHVAVFVTPVFERFDINTVNVMNNSKNGGESRIGYNGKARTDAVIKTGKPVYSPTGQLISDGEEVPSNAYIYYSAAFPDRKYLYNDLTELINNIKNSEYYLLKEIPTSTLITKEKEWVKVDIDDYVLENLTEQRILPPDAFGISTSFVNPKVVFSYNGRIHYANYLKSLSSIFSSDGFIERDYSAGGRLDALNFITAYGGYSADRMIQVLEVINPKTIAGVTESREDILNKYITKYNALVGIATDEDNAIIATELPIEGEYQKVIPSFLTLFPAKLHSLIGYINQFRATNILECERYIRTYDLEDCTYYQISFEVGITKYVRDGDNLPIIADEEYPNVVKVKDEPNGLAVSAVDNPFYFPAETVYRVGNSEILALMSNAIAVGTGQTGAAPLYIFCKDGIYAMFVDESGTFAYLNARILARDICNNPRSVTPIDAGVVFSTDRGLMMIAGEQVQEIGAPAEGDVVQFWNAGSVDYSKIATASMQQIAGLPSALCSTTDFLTYLQDKGSSGKAAIINYNHNMRELMVSNPNYPYSYVLDREGNWSRRDYTAAQYVNNYPTSYRVDADGHFYKVDDEGDANTSLEHRKEADNKIFYLSNVIKLDSIGFKQAYRFVVRGYFETIDRVAGIINGREVYIYGVNIPGETRRIVYRQYYVEGDYHWFWYDGLDPIGITIIDKYTGEDVTHTCATPNASQYFTIEGEVCSMACVVEGSYDGRKFKPLGYNRKSGKFRDIGCLVSHTDVRFFRICLSGQVTGKTRIDYMELSADGSKLNTKIR